MQKNWRVRIGVSSDADCLIGRRGFFNQSQNVVEWMPQALSSKGSDKVFSAQSLFYCKDNRLKFPYN